MPEEELEGRLSAGDSVTPTGPRALHGTCKAPVQRSSCSKFKFRVGVTQWAVNYDQYSPARAVTWPGVPGCPASPSALAWAVCAAAELGPEVLPAPGRGGSESVDFKFKFEGTPGRAQACQ